MREPTRHGGLVEEELTAVGVRAEDVLDLSVNVNPYGPCAAIRLAVAEAPLHRYPDPKATPARRALAELSEVPADRVVLGNGAVDILWTLARVILRPGDIVTVVEPAFSEMRTAAACMGARFVEYQASVRNDFATDFDALETLLRTVRPRLLYICSPSNPPGVCTPLKELEELAARHQDTLFVVDISFLSLSERHAEKWGAERIVWIRSLTKDHALAGLRVGYAVMPAALAARLESERPPWSVNSLAQAAAIAATTEEALRFVDESRARMLRDRVYLVDALRSLGLRPHRSETVYVLADLGSRTNATELRHGLLCRHRVLVRDGASFGLPNHVRIAARPRHDLQRLVTALHQELFP